jgi:signal transduction histidine kinase
LDQSENLTSFQKTAIKAISEKGEQLGSLVDKLLRFTMAESDSLRCEPQPISLLPILQEALSSLESDRIEKGTKLTVDPALDKNTTIYADAALVLEVLKNIIENGIKFNDKKEQTLSISVFGKPDELILKISDNGCGIPAEEMDKIFQKFYQVENSFTGQVPGAGLGLALCKRIMEILKGKITIESQLGEGTTVLLSFPISISKK